MTKRFSRRRFLRDGSATLAAAVVGCGDTHAPHRDAGSDSGSDLIGSSSYDAGAYDAAWFVDEDAGSTVAPDFDLVVIGSGFAGAYLAQRAVDAGLTTAIVEAGFDPKSDRDVSEAFKFVNTGAVEYPLNSQRIVALGGTSNHWGGVISRPYPDDFRLRSKYGIMDDWPIGYDDVEPYLCEAEQLLSVRGQEPTRGEAPRECAYPKGYKSAFEDPAVAIEGEVPDYFTLPRSKASMGRPVRLIETVLPAFEDSARATLLVGRQVTRLVTVDGRRIDHIETMGIDGEIDRIGARWFVLAAGAIENPRLLLLSTSAFFPNGLGNGSDLVGRHFSVHPAFETSFEAGMGVLDKVANGEFRTFSLHDVLRSDGLNAFHFHVNIDGDRMHWRLHPEIDSRRENRVTLASKKDIHGDPQPELSLAYSDRDERTFERIREVIKSLKTSLGARMDTIRDFERWRGHPAGTTRMAVKSSDGVVNADNRVFGLDNLFVSGASTFTVQGSINPTNLVVALSLRLADHIIGLREAGD